MELVREQHQPIPALRTLGENSDKILIISTNKSARQRYEKSYFAQESLLQRMQEIAEQQQHADGLFPGFANRQLTRARRGTMSC